MAIFKGTQRITKMQLGNGASVKAVFNGGTLVYPELLMTSPSGVSSTSYSFKSACQQCALKVGSGAGYSTSYATDNFAMYTGEYSGWLTWWSRVNYSSCPVYYRTELRAAPGLGTVNVGIGWAKFVDSATVTEVTSVTVSINSTNWTPVNVSSSFGFDAYGRYAPVIIGLTGYVYERNALAGVYL